MKTLLTIATLVLIQSYTPTKISPSDLSVGYSEIVGTGESRAANIGIRNDSKTTLKNVVVSVKLQFQMSSKGTMIQGERTEMIPYAEIKAGQTAAAPVKFNDRVVKITSAVVESVVQRK